MGEDSVRPVDARTRRRWRGGALATVGVVLAALVTVTVQAPAWAANLSVSGPKTVAASGARDVEIAFDGTNHLVVWATSDTLRAARVGGAGTVVQLGQIANNVYTESTAPVDVAFNGTSFLVVWTDSGGSGNIKARRIATSGGLTGANFVVEGSAHVQARPAVAAAGSNFTVVWQDSRTGAGDIYGRRVSGGGALLGTSAIRISTDDREDEDPDIAYNGSTLLVTYQLRYDGVDTDVVGRRIGTGGVLLGGVFGIGTGTQAESTPAVASNGGGWYVVWEDGGDVLGMPVTASGSTVLDRKILIVDEAGLQDRPKVAFNGSYLVAWADGRLPENRDVYASRVSIDGAVQDPDGFPIAESTSVDEDFPSVAAAKSTNTWAVDVVTINGAVEHRTTPAPK